MASQIPRCKHGTWLSARGNKNAWGFPGALWQRLRRRGVHQGILAERIARRLKGGLRRNGGR